MMAFMADVDRLRNRRERAMIHSAETPNARACALDRSRLAQIDRLIDHVAWCRMLKTRSTSAEFPPQWVETVKAGGRAASR